MDHLKGGTEIGRALTFTADYFDGSKGGRLSVPQYLIVVTDGYSSDSVVAPATALRDKGIITFAIGVAESPWEQLREIAGSDDQVHFIEEYDALEQVKTDILSKICDSHKDCGRAEIADIIFVIDGSFNINKEQFQFVKTFMVALVNSSDVGMSNVRFGAVLYDTNPHTIFHLNELKSKAEVQNEINAIGNLTKGQTYTSKALNHAKKLLAPEYNGRNSGKVPQILILITHEKAADNAVLETTAQSIRDHGVSIYAIGVAGADLKELNLIAGSDKYFYVPRYDNLRYLTPNISQLICDASNLDCEVEKADIVFLIDGSGSVQTDDFQLIKEFLKNVITMFDTGEGKVQFALGQYSVDLHPEIYLKDQSKLYDGIDKMNQLGGGTNTGRALTSVNDFFEPTEGCRKNEGVPQYLLVITDGQSQDSVVAPANGLRRQQVNVFAIGVGEAVDSELIQIAGDANRKYSIKNFADLNNIKRRVTRSICACSSKDCSMNIAVGFDLTHPIGEEIFTGQHGLQAKLENILQRIGSVDKINCASNPSLKIRVGFHIQSDTGEAIFETELKEYNRKDVDDLKGIRTTSRIDLNEGYLASFSNKFIESAGKIQVVLMFTDGLDDNLERLEKTSRILRKGGVHALITVALENAVDVDNISLIEFGRGFEYKNQLSIGMQDIESSLLNQINVIAGRECCNLFCTCTGEPGRRGDHGSPGPKGSSEVKGLPGNEGPGGESGERGPPGLTGNRGNMGCQGPRGFKGRNGYPGEMGSEGEQAIDGINGEEGTVGIVGMPGEKGIDGDRGKKGPKGDHGERGELGLRGDPGIFGSSNNVTGPKGVEGVPGPQGNPGKEGIQGETGSFGNIGPQGHRGLQGPKGENGQPGERGRKGDPGPQGPANTEGLPGQQGPKGEQGPRGVQGRLGAPGRKGSKGNDGGKGPNGQFGEPGNKGERGPLDLVD
ncbi:collagen alpha-6(VI) chain-like [Callorhinchus milii]|uniref:collagen alpha-6(VI) chain-like n=1 Tax=Callorhinchus milii TaxID=7868 RepID=UPI001C3FA81D|nr:collagen alpha-6(VI) chain-like [Callorhinchus milii]